MDLWGKGDLVRCRRRPHDVGVPLCESKTSGNILKSVCGLQEVHHEMLGRTGR